MVLQDFNAKTAILLNEPTASVLQLVCMDDGPLGVTALSRHKFNNIGYRTLDGYPIEKAVIKYLNHQAGVTANAKRELLRLIGRTSDEGLPINKKVISSEDEKPLRKKDIIWNLGDSYWEEAGSPKSKKVVLELRKKMYLALKELGIDQHSASNELGRWQKVRIPDLTD